MMQLAGVNVVRMGEFAWSAHEPQDGRLDFTWMEDAIELLAEHGIKTILCTCSRTPPPWIHRKFPGILNRDAHGTAHFSDGRYCVGITHGSFISESQRIYGALIRHFAGNKNVVAWQIDNEIGSGNDCFCKECRKAFQSYLREKYGTTQALGDAWGRH